MGECLSQSSNTEHFEVCDRAGVMHFRGHPPAGQLAGPSHMIPTNLIHAHIIPLTHASTRASDTHQLVSDTHEHDSGTLLTSTDVYHTAITRTRAIAEALLHWTSHTCSTPHLSIYA